MHTKQQYNDYDHFNKYYNRFYNDYLLVVFMYNTIIICL